MAAAYAFGRGRKVRPGAVRAGKEGRPFAVVGRWKNFFDFFVDRGAAFWQCAFLPRGCSSVGRALEWHSRGQEFNSPQLHQKGNQGLRKRRPFFRFWPRKHRQQKSRGSSEPRPFCIRLKEPSVRVCATAHGSFCLIPFASPSATRQKGVECACAHT